MNVESGCIFCKHLECKEGEYAKMRPAVLDINKKVTYRKALEYAREAGPTWDLPMLWEMENNCPWCEVAKINSTFDDFCEACPIDWDDETRTCKYQWSNWIDAVESGNVEKAISLAKKLSCVRER